LGSGAFGTVYKGQDIITGELVAIKITIINRINIGLQHKAIASFNRETEEHMQLLQHEGVINLKAWSKAPQIVTYKNGVKKEVLFSVQELAENGEFLSYVNIPYHKLNDSEHPDFPFSTELTRFYFKQLIEAVGYLHLMGLVHRDLKLDNLMFDKEFNLKIGDFGYQKKGEKSNEIIFCSTSIGTRTF
jgi:serine/threonine protein kinase